MPLIRSPLFSEKNLTSLEKNVSVGRAFGYTTWFPEHGSH